MAKKSLKIISVFLLSVIAFVMLSFVCSANFLFGDDNIDNAYVNVIPYAENFFGFYSFGDIVGVTPNSQATYGTKTLIYNDFTLNNSTAYYDRVFYYDDEYIEDYISPFMDLYYDFNVENYITSTRYRIATNRLNSFSAVTYYPSTYLYNAHGFVFLGMWYVEREKNYQKSDMLVEIKLSYLDENDNLQVKQYNLTVPTTDTLVYDDYYHEQYQPGSVIIHQLIDDDIPLDIPLHIDYMKVSLVQDGTFSCGISNSYVSNVDTYPIYNRIYYDAFRGGSIFDSDISVKEITKTVFEGVHEMLKIEILPSLSLYSIIGTAILLPTVITILRRVG